MKTRSFFSILFVVVGIIAAGFISYFTFKEVKRNKQIRGEIDTLKNEADRLRQNNKDIQEKIVYFETPEFQEKIAKEKLNLQKDNENVAIIKSSPISKDQQLNESGPQKQESAFQEEPNYKKWRDQFFKY